MRSKLGGIVPFHTNLDVPKMHNVSPLPKHVPSSVGYAATFPQYYLFVAVTTFFGEGKRNIVP